MEGSENRNQPHLCLSKVLSEEWKYEFGEPEGPTAPNCPTSLQGLTGGSSRRRRNSNRARKGTGAGLKTQGRADSHLAPPIRHNGYQAPPPPLCLLGLVVLSCTTWFFAPLEQQARPKQPISSPRMSRLLTLKKTPEFSFFQS